MTIKRIGSYTNKNIFVSKLTNTIVYLKHKGGGAIDKYILFIKLKKMCALIMSWFVTAKCY